MKNLALITLMIMLGGLPTASHAQWIKKLGQKAVEKAKDKVENKVERTVDKAADRVLDGKKDEPKEKDKRKQHDGQQQTEQAEAELHDDTAATPKDNRNSAATISWNSYDFISGDEIIFEDTMEDEQIGEFPSKWDIFRGYAQIAELNGAKCISLSADGSITPLFNDNKPYLTDEFTIEYDVWIVYGPDYNTDFNPHSWRLHTYLPSKEKICEHQSGFNFHHQVSTNRDAKTLDDAYFSYDWPIPNSDDHRSGNTRLHNVAINSWHHVAISFNKRAYKVYFDERRVVNIPNAAKPSYFWIACNQDEPVFFIKNVRIAKGAVPLYERLASDGKIVTYAITFDTGKATIKPESTGEINRITKIMQDDPSIKFEVQGHCDNTGSDKVNDPLSQQRAEAIVAAFVANGIEASRLTAVGKGAHEPIADNGTDEGRAKNRRVEFVKQ